MMLNDLTDYELGKLRYQLTLRCKSFGMMCFTVSLAATVFHRNIVKKFPVLKFSMKREESRSLKLVIMFLFYIYRFLKIRFCFIIDRFE